MYIYPYIRLMYGFIIIRGTRGVFDWHILLDHLFFPDLIVIFITTTNSCHHNNNNHLSTRKLSASYWLSTNLQ